MAGAVGAAVLRRGAAVEAWSGPVHWFAWTAVGVVLTLMAAGWVNARRKVCAVELTDETLRQGQQELPVARIAALHDGDAPGAPVLGGGLTVPRKTTEVPLTLDDGSVVLAWARFPGRMRAALNSVLRKENG
ncbi:hypothetical protein ACFQV2_36285 [Actinokineospora soli]|uniref:PH domain-containing protein n=1 Tax=Actinokineospora soli TaxID=1048753 RepID=A0ABW2TVX2_9PSEU